MQTFRERVIDFWQWFPTQVDAIASALNSDDPRAGLEPLIEGFRIGGLSWVFGPGKEGSGLSFTVSGEGQKPRQLLSHYWLEQAVEIEGWDFYASRQPSPQETLANLGIDVGDRKVDMDSIKVTPKVDEENQQVDLEVWHSVFDTLPNQNRMRILFLLLDEALGEFGTQIRLGELAFKPQAESAMPLIELPSYLNELWEEKGWEDTSPLESYVGYQGEPSDQFCRADTIAGYTNLPHVVLGYLNNRGPLDDDPLEDTGAELLFVEIQDVGAEKIEDALAYRNQIEEEIVRQLGGGGYVTGVSTGTMHSYIDVLIVDGECSRAAIDNAIRMSHEGPFEYRKFFAN